MDLSKLKVVDSADMDTPALTQNNMKAVIVSYIEPIIKSFVTGDISVLKKYIKYSTTELFTRFKIPLNEDDIDKAASDLYEYFVDQRDAKVKSFRDSKQNKLTQFLKKNTTQTIFWISTLTFKNKDDDGTYDLIFWAFKDSYVYDPSSKLYTTVYFRI